MVETHAPQVHHRTDLAMRPLALAFALAFCGLAAGPASGQIALSGTILEFESQTVIDGAFVEVLDRNFRRLGSVTSREDGTFQLEVPEKRAYRLRVSRLGYKDTETPVLWRDGYDRIHLDVRLDPEVVVLAPLEVVARSRPRTSSVLDGFRDRFASGIGHFITRAEIRERAPGFVTDLLATVPGVRLESSGRGTRRTVYMARAIAECPAQIFVDGFHMNRELRSGYDYGFALDDAVDPEDVEGIEVYNGLSTVPAEFLTPQSNCGVIAIWTRRGTSDAEWSAAGPPQGRNRDP